MAAELMHMAIAETKIFFFMVFSLIEQAGLLSRPHPVERVALIKLMADPLL